MSDTTPSQYTGTLAEHLDDWRKDDAPVRIVTRSGRDYVGPVVAVAPDAVALDPEAGTVPPGMAGRFVPSYTVIALDSIESVTYA